MIPCHAQTSLNVTNFGAIGDAVHFSVSTVSNSAIVEVLGTNTFTSADTNKIIEVFRAGPWLQFSNDPPYATMPFYGSHPGNAFVVTNQDIICYLANVSNGTNLTLSTPCGWTTNAYCIVGTNNALAFQAAVNDASNLVANGTATNVTIHVPVGTYLLISSNALNPNYVMTSIFNTATAVTISTGGITFLGDSATNTVLMDCGAGMEHILNSTYPYNSLGYFNPLRGNLFFCSGPVTNSQYPLEFENLTFDGGLTNGQQSYSYYDLHEGNGDGWDSTHDALLDIGAGQMNQVKVFANCIFQHWRGEILKSVTGSGSTNTYIDITNCVFNDGNASCFNFSFAHRIENCQFYNIEQLTEFYESYATGPSFFDNNFWSNNFNGGIVINGSRTNANPYPYTIANNTGYIPSGSFAVLFTPAENVTVVSNTFINGTVGIFFTGSGLQPSDGTASSISNILIADNDFNGTYLPISMDGYPAYDVLITNNTASTTYLFIMGAWFKTNIVMIGNTCPAYPYSVGITNGSYFVDVSNNFGAYYGDSTYSALTNSISYQFGRYHAFYAASNSVYYLDDSHPNLIPPGAVMRIKRASGQYPGPLTIPVYSSSKLSSTGKISLSTGQSVTYEWTNGSWRLINPSTVPPPYGLQMSILRH
ncbi:MAG: hypothetical protein ACREFE_00265 [Limisphaerales bacterium]